MQALRNLRSSKLVYGVALGSGLVGVTTLTYKLINAPPPRDDPDPPPHRPEPKLPGPMIAVYLDDNSVKQLRDLYPDALESRMRKVVLEYGPSDEGRASYESLFGKTATVKLTGEASSSGRRALVASISLAGGLVEPQALAPAIDVTQGEEGGGPLGSAVLIEQIKRAGAHKKSSWEGILPSFFWATGRGEESFYRRFPEERGEYVQLKEPITVKGSICRADWLDGCTARCRTRGDGGEEGGAGFKSSGCPLCDILRSSPCCGIFTKWNALAAVIDTKSEKSEKFEQGEEDAAGQGGTPKDPASSGADGGQREPGGGEGSGSGTGRVKGDDVDVEAQEKSAELVEELAFEMNDCIAYRRVMLDAHADGLIRGAEEEARESSDDD